MPVYILTLYLESSEDLIEAMSLDQLIQ
jgi:hypothetical protein